MLRFGIEIGERLLLRMRNDRSVTTLILGDLILDRYIEGHVRGISPEAPVPVLVQGSERDILGGAGNVANNIVALGGGARLVGVLGEDEAGDRFIELANVAGVKIFPLRDPSRKTTKKTRLLGGRQQLLRVDNESRQNINESLELKAFRIIEENISLVDSIIISDYKKGFLTESLVKKTISLANSMKIPVFVDPKGEDLSIYRGADYIKPNKGELEILTRIKCNTLEDIEKAAHVLMEKTGSNILITLSQDGMLLMHNDGSKIMLPTVAREIFDVSGAGDTAIASFAYAISQSASPDVAAKFANISSGIAVSKVGTATVSLEEINQEIRRIYFNTEGYRGSNIDINQAVKIREIWREKGFKVGFTNGCFDLLHPGHIALLQGAAKACDRLIIAINSDSSVKRLKGADRPIQSEQARAEVMGAIECVDLIVIFNEDTPLEVIKLLKPDLLVKGADYEEKDIIGADFVTRIGGSVLRISLKEGCSTTGLIDRFKH